MANAKKIEGLKMCESHHDAGAPVTNTTASEQIPSNDIAAVALQKPCGMVDMYQRPSFCSEPLFESYLRFRRTRYSSFVLAMLFEE